MLFHFFVAVLALGVSMAAFVYMCVMITHEVTLLRRRMFKRGASVRHTIPLVCKGNLPSLFVLWAGFGCNILIAVWFIHDVLLFGGL